MGSMFGFATRLNMPSTPAQSDPQPYFLADRIYTNEALLDNPESLRIKSIHEFYVQERYISMSQTEQVTRSKKVLTTSWRKTKKKKE